METIRYRPVLHRMPFKEDISLGILDECCCKRLFLAGRINDDWSIEIYESEQEEPIATEKPSVLWNK